MQKTRGKDYFCAKNSRFSYNGNILEEKGITLIALIVTIIVMLILAGATISSIVGDESILDLTLSTDEEYQITQYGEQVEEIFQSILIKHNLLGETIRISQIATEMANEDWISTAEVESDYKIRVTVDEGYQYLVYYNSDTGDKITQYIGFNDGTLSPIVVTAEATSTTKIDASATCDDGIETIELIYKGESDSYSTSGTAASKTFTISNTGLFEIKATSTNGLVGYDYVRISEDGIGKPVVSFDGTEGDNNWYTSDLTVTISVEHLSNATGFTYWTSNDSTEITVSGTSKTISITDQGWITIYAVALDSSGNESRVSFSSAKYDSEKPNNGDISNVSDDITYTGTYVDASDGTRWYTSDVIISLENAYSDTTSGIAGYYYSIGSADNMKGPYDLTKTLTFEGEGEREIYIYAKDNAGNVTDVSGPIPIYKDTVAPQDFLPSVDTITSSGFTVKMYTMDATSGVDYYDVYVDNQYYGKVSDVGNGETVSYIVSGLSANTTYTVYVEAVDKAENVKSTKASISVTTESPEPVYTWQVYTLISSECFDEITISTLVYNAYTMQINKYIGNGGTGAALNPSYWKMSEVENVQALSSWMNIEYTLGQTGFGYVLCSGTASLRTSCFCKAYFGAQCTNLYSYCFNYLTNSWCLYEKNYVACGIYGLLCLVNTNLTLSNDRILGTLDFDGWYFYRDITTIYSRGDFTGTYVTSSDADAYPSSGYLLTGDTIGWFELVDE